MELCKDHPEVYRTLASNAPRARPGRKKAGSPIGVILHQFSRHATHSVAHLAIRLAQEKPDFFAAFERGEYRSIRAAAIAAGLVASANVPLPRMKFFWKKASKKDREAFLKWIKTDDAK